jgi:hypothetical protein
VASETIGVEAKLIKLNKVNFKPIDAIAEESQFLTNSLGHDDLLTKQALFLSFFLIEFKPFLMGIMSFLGDGLKLNLPSIGVQASTAGDVAVVHSLDGGVESDIEVSLASEVLTNFPVFITVGGARVHASLEKQEKRMSQSDKKGHSSLDVSIGVSISTKAASINQCYEFAYNLQQYLNNPTTLD